MIRLVVGIVVLVAGVLWLPVWLQVLLFAIAIVVTPNRFFLIIPAIVSDALYAPRSALSVTAHWMTLLVLVMLGLHYLIMKKLRIRTLYGLEA